MGLCHTRANKQGLGQSGTFLSALQGRGGREAAGGRRRLAKPAKVLRPVLAAALGGKSSTNVKLGFHARCWVVMTLTVARPGQRK